MNKQDKGSGKRGIEWTDYTWNPIAGCFHACQWVMPSGEIANCYAEDVAENVAQSAYPQGFEHNYWKPSLLREPISQKQPSKIFVGSMADIFGHWVEEEHIVAVLNVARQAPQHQFQFLTKNPKRALDFLPFIPANCWIGASSPPDFMWNKSLNQVQKERMLSVTLDVLTGVSAEIPITWMSFEPLSWDVTKIVRQYPDALKWAVIGAASNGRTYYPPEEPHVRNLLNVLDEQDAKVFFKGNMKSLPWARENWRADFPEWT